MPTCKVIAWIDIEIREQIVGRFNNSFFISVMADKTTDCGSIQQLALCVRQGRPSPQSQWCISTPYFRFHPLFRIFRCLGTFSQFLPKMYVSPATIYDDSPPYFRQNNTFPAVSENVLFFPYFAKFPPSWFRWIYLFFCMLYVFFASPYFDHDALMHHAMHLGLLVLDAPGFWYVHG